jgi:CRISPR-associated protein Cmr6
MTVDVLPQRRRPLYGGLPGTEPARIKKGNAGLWYDKFCDEWADNWIELYRPTKQDAVGGKLRWLQGVAGDPVGDVQLLREAALRQADLTEKRGGKLFRLSTVWRFASGLGRSHPVENGFAWHHGLGTPYLPGSSVKGVARAWAIWSGEDAFRVERIFGPKVESGADLHAGSVVFLDALPIEPVALDADVMTPHYSPWYQAGEAPGDWNSPTPIPFLTVAPDQTFQFALLPRTPADTSDCNRAEELLREALASLGAGAKTAAGYGVFGEAAGEANDAAATASSGPGIASRKPPARLPSGTLVQARLTERKKTGRNKEDKWRALHEESGVIATVEGNPPEGCEPGAVFELLCTSGTNFKWPTEEDRQRLSNPARKPGVKPVGKGTRKGGR